MTPCESRNDVVAATGEPVRTAECGIASFGSVNLSHEELAAIRKAPEPHLGLPLAASVARHCDEQTIAVLSAVSRAVRQLGARQTDFESWGIVASTRYLGRSFFSQALDKFDREGPWNTSVQVVPHRSLHSTSSTISLVLGCHGPNVGVGGAIDGEGQALLTAASMLNEFALPGVWLVLAGWSPELNVDAVGQPTHEARCHALALALKPTCDVPGGLQLRIVPDQDACDDSAISYAGTRNSNWLSLLTTLLHKESQNLNVIAPLCDGLRVELVWNSAGAAATHDAQAPLRAAG